MINKGPIVYIDDDQDDQALFQMAVESLQIPNALRLFSNGLEALHYLETTEEKPLLILCDINMPLMSGIELRKHINQTEYLRRKAIPFVFYTTGVNSKLVEIAYDHTVQGFYEKARSYANLQQQIRLLVEYWENCLHPNSEFTSYP